MWGHGVNWPGGALVRPGGVREGTFEHVGMDLLMRRVDKIEGRCAAPVPVRADPASFPTKPVLERMDNDLLKNGMEPDCCNIWQVVAQLADEEAEYFALPEAEEGIHPREAS
jgi:hypothetical protein